MKKTKDYLFFWGGILSNWAEVPGGIKYNKKIFPTSEHLFMWLKAYSFGDLDTMNKIEHAKTPKEAKRLGRKVMGFDEEVWRKARETCMSIALRNKAESWPEFKNLLINTPQTFVEASPYDRIWGIGLGETSPGIEDPKNWAGENLLGKCLCKVRDEILENNGKNIN